jgi:WD40 repeat protein
VWSVSFSPDGRQIISVGDDLRVWDGSWLAKRPSNHALIEDVCTTLLLGSDLTGDFNNSVAGSIRRISRQDVESVSILRGRSGQDVCASRGMFE